jgi:hypothetical protein
LAIEPPPEAEAPGRPNGRLAPPGRLPPTRGPPGRWKALGPSGELRGARSTGLVRLPFFTASLICISWPLIFFPVSVSMASCPFAGSRNSTIANPRGLPSSSSATMISSTESPNGSKYGFRVSTVVRASRFPT